MNSIGKEFMEKTKFHYLDRSDQSNNLPQPLLEREYDASKPLIDLPGPEKIKIGSLGMGKEDTGISILMQDMPARTCTWAQAL